MVVEILLESKENSHLPSWYNFLSAAMARTIHDYFRQAFRKLSGLPRSGAPVSAAVFGAGDNYAAFHLVISAGLIVRAEYRCTTCVTLVALCEHLAELAVGMPVEEASRCGPGLLLARHPEIPAERRDRAGLAVRAFQAALATTLNRGATS